MHWGARVRLARPVSKAVSAPTVSAAMRSTSMIARVTLRYASPTSTSASACDENGRSDAGIDEARVQSAAASSMSLVAAAKDASDTSSAGPECSIWLRRRLRRSLPRLSRISICTGEL